MAVKSSNGAKEKRSLTRLGGETPTDGANATIEYSEPYSVGAQIIGTAPIIYHRWNCEAVEEKSKAAKGSKAKKSDDIESYLYRNTAGEICLPGEYVRQAIIHAAKFKQDPRSPRKSAMDLFKAGIVCLTELASHGTKEYYEDRRRVTVQRNGITRCRPALQEGWEASLVFSVLVPEYISPALLQEVLTLAGRLVGVADFRPTYGRFAVSNFEVLND